MRSTRPTLAVLLALLLLATCAVTLTLSALAYPGGNYHDPLEPGFSMLRNHWCDLLRNPAHDGRDSREAAGLARIAFGALSLSLVPFWVAAGALLTGPRRWALSALGGVSALLVWGIALVPSDRFPSLHGVMALTAVGLGMGAASWSVVARTPGEGRWSLRRSLGAGALAASLTNAGLYAHVVYLGGRDTQAMPTVQKLATALVLAWMLVTLRASERLRRQRAKSSNRGKGAS